MSAKITLNPVTRIEGRLAVNVEIAADPVSRGVVSGEIYRGFEQMIAGAALRRPRTFNAVFNGSDRTRNGNSQNA